MKKEALAVLTARVNIDVLPHVQDDVVLGLGVRLRPYGKQAAKDVMIIGYGATFEEALVSCYGKAYENRWESLQWAARPWAVAHPLPDNDPFAGPSLARKDV